MQLKDLLDLVGGDVDTVVLPPEWAERARRYAVSVWEGCLFSIPPPACAGTGLKTHDPRRLVAMFTAGLPDCVLNVVLDAETGEPFDHLPFDWGGEDDEKDFRDLSTGYEGPPHEDVVVGSLTRLGESGTPAAILDFGDTSYIQCYRSAEDAYEFEHQLVTTAFHYVVPRTLTQREVIEAFLDCARGGFEWSRRFPWTLHPMSL